MLSGGLTESQSGVSIQSAPSPRSAYEPGETLGDCGRNKVTLGGASPRVGVVSHGAARLRVFECVKTRRVASLAWTLAFGYRERDGGRWFGEIATHLKNGGSSGILGLGGAKKVNL